MTWTRLLVGYALALTVALLVLLDYYNIPSRWMERLRPTEVQTPVARPVASYATVKRALIAHYHTRSARIVMLGDSHIDHLSWWEFLGRNDVVNRGVGGDESLDVLRRLDQVLALSPCLCVLMVGINDLQHERPPSLVAARIGEIVARLRRHGVHVLLVSVLPVGLTFKRHPVWVNLGVATLNRSLRALADTPGVDYMDLTKELAPDGFMPAQRTLRDGLHFTADVYLVWRQRLQAYLARWEASGGCRRAHH
ncbi:MAG: hypothetical protein D6678_00330 [Zetaproteobacteria bacterium]|nr:MAG: hypothetical protein D6678_00330 [Zetaproteobacteria bacterium]